MGVIYRKIGIIMFENLKISTRFGIVIAVTILSFFIVFALGFYTFNVSKQRMIDLYQGGVEDIAELDKIRDLYEEKLLRTIFRIDLEQVSMNEGLEIIKEGHNNAKTVWEHYRNKDNSNELIPKDAQALENNAQTQINEISQQIGKLQEALRLNQKEQFQSLIDGGLTQSIHQVMGELRDLTQWHTKDSTHDFHSGLEALASAETWSLLIFTLSSLIIISIVIWIALSVIRPLKLALEAIHRLTVGDLSYQIGATSKNEIGELLDAMKSLNTSSREVTAVLTSVSNGNLAEEFKPRSEEDTLGIAVVTMITNLRSIIGEIQDQVTNVTTSVQEIASTISQVATSSSETAAAVTETTTSVEELKQTAHVTDEKAKDVLNSSEDTLQTVSSSEKFLQNTMDDMKQINERMRAISEGIVKLSEHSKTIGDIIDTVNDLAEQSNLLAVNAAIEAAKAGEHGKSFAVVAQEIRTLAEQSKAATIQVRSILNEIQNATSSAVLATEQGAKAVEKGVKQSAETNESMQMLSQSITKVTQYANQIALSSQQQFVGIDQVTVAMNNISGATGLLVDHMRQIETAISCLNNVSDKLKEMTHRYILNKESQSILFSKKQNKRV